MTTSAASTRPAERLSERPADHRPDYPVVIAGGGPTGMMLAAELALGGVDCAIVERRVDQHVDGSRAGGLHARTIEVLDQRGVAERFLDAGTAMQTAAFALIPLDLSDLAGRNHGLALFQSVFEPILAEWVAELGVTTLRSAEVVGFGDVDDGLAVTLGDGAVLRTRYLVGCDGGRSTVRKAAGIAFDGLDPTTTWLIAEVRLPDRPAADIRRDGDGNHGIAPIGGDDDRYRIVIMGRHGELPARPTLEDLRSHLVRIWGTDFGAVDPTWLSSFDDTSRQAATYRSGRVLLAGDAAHIHPPMGGQGLNLGVQDAVNLGWKLAQVVSGVSPESLLDTYHDERHPVGARVLQLVRAQGALFHNDERHVALQQIVGELLSLDAARHHLGAAMAGLAVTYGGDGDHPLVGRRMPDVALTVDGAPTRVFELLRAARPVLLHLGTPGPFAALAEAGRITVVNAVAAGPIEVPGVGAVATPHAVLIRPDGHVAWVGDSHDAALDDAVSRWFGRG